MNNKPVSKAIIKAIALDCPRNCKYCNNTVFLNAYCTLGYQPKGYWVYDGEIEIVAEYTKRIICPFCELKDGEGSNRIS